MGWLGSVLGRKVIFLRLEGRDWSFFGVLWCCLVSGDVGKLYSFYRGVFKVDLDVGGIVRCKVCWEIFLWRRR